MTHLRLPYVCLALLLALTACDGNDPEPDEGEFQLNVSGDSNATLSGEASFGGSAFATPAIHLNDNEGTEGDLFIYWVNALSRDDAPAVPEVGDYDVQDVVNGEPGSLPRFSFYAYLDLENPDGPDDRFFSAQGKLTIESSDENEIVGTISFNDIK